MDSNVKLLLNNMIKDMSKVLDTKIVVMDKNNQILVAEGLEGYAIGDVLKINDEFKASMLMESNLTNIYIGTNELILADFDDLRMNLKETLDKLMVRFRSLQAITVPIGQGRNSIGVLTIYLTEDILYILDIDKLQSMLNIVYATTLLVADRASSIKQFIIRPIDEIEKEMMITALKRIGNSTYDINIIAEKLGMSRATFYRKCKKYNIDIQNSWY